MTQDKHPEPCILDVFMAGETIDLCVPRDDPRVIDQWYRWFNDPSITRYTNRGCFPNTPLQQRAFLEEALAKGTRLLLMIRPKHADYLVGVASLTFMQEAKRSCGFAMVIGHKDEHPDSVFYGMETKALMTQYAFETLGVERIHSQQVKKLIRWQRWQVLFGYQIEGIMRNYFRRGLDVQDTMVASCILEDYLRLKNMRKGSFWPGKKKMFELLKRLPEESMIDRLETWLAKERNRIWSEIAFVVEE